METFLSDNQSTKNYFVKLHSDFTHKNTEVDIFEDDGVPHRTTSN